MIVISVQAPVALPQLMMPPIQIISTDFDGTLYAEFENPPVPQDLQTLIARMQAAGTKWVINTGRDLSSLLEALGRSHLSVKPDYLVIVEREIYLHDNSQYVSIEEWNGPCTECHSGLFARIRPDLPGLIAWVNENFAATVYEDSYSPFCLIAERHEDADRIHEYLNVYCDRVPGLSVVRNDVYARFSHIGYNKGTALAEIARRLGVASKGIFAVGDHLNDLPMLNKKFAGCIAAPANAIDLVKEHVLNEGGYLSPYPRGDGVRDSLEFFIHSVPKSEKYNS